MPVVNPSSATDFVPAVMIYRRACATAHQARARADEHQSTGRSERRLREVDAAVETIVLAQAACEGWVHAAYRLAGIDPPQGGWVARWQAAPRAICGPGARDLDTTTVESLRWLSRWRNYLVHDDAQARERLHQFVAAGSEVQQLTAAMATEVIERCDVAFADAGSILGATTLAGLHSDFLWRAADES
jgi:hypothetical protein